MDEIGWFLPTAASAPLFLLLVAGHLLGDFCFQSRWMVENKHRHPALLAHGVVITVVHLAVLAPLLTLPVAGAVIGVGSLHAAVDRLKVRWAAQRSGALGVFLVDQAVHLAMLGSAAALLSRWAPPPSHLSPANTQLWVSVMLTFGVFAFNWTGGSAIVRATLAGVSPELEADASARADGHDGGAGSGRVIGILERSIALILILLGEWATLALLIAVKSIARFEALKHRTFAEYYLIGTLTSLLVAMVSGLFLRLVIVGAS